MIGNNAINIALTKNFIAKLSFQSIKQFPYFHFILWKYLIKMIFAIYLGKFLRTTFYDTDCLLRSCFNSNKFTVITGCHSLTTISN